MAALADRLIEVRGAWNAWRTAEVRVGSLADAHWFQPAGAPRPIIHAYISCTDIVTGEIPHECDATPGKHRLLVCILKRSASPDLYAELVRRADAHFPVPHVTGPPRVSRTAPPLRAIH